MAINLANPVNWQVPLNRRRVLWNFTLSNISRNNVITSLCSPVSGTLGVDAVTSRIGYGQYPMITTSTGTNGHVDYGTNDRLNFTSSFTIACWLKTTATNAYIFDRTGASPYNGYGFAVVGSSFGSFSGQLGAYSKGMAGWKGATTAINDGVWRRVGVVFDTSNSLTTFYVNGISDGFYSGSNAPVGGSITGRLGNSANDTIYGIINVSDFCIWERALSASEMYSDYTSSRMVYPYELIRPRKSIINTVAAGSFKSAWARGSNVILQPGVLT